MLLGLFPAFVSAHEPVFGPGPRTIWKDGVGFSSQNEWADRENEATGDTESERTHAVGMVYGVTDRLALGLRLPYKTIVHEKGGVSETHGGMADLSTLVKWNVWRNTGKRYLDGVTLLGGLRLPTGEREENISNGSTGYVMGLTAAREHLRYYAFASALYFTSGPGSDGSRPGDVLQYNLTPGIRPRIGAYTDPDLVLLAEFVGRLQRASTSRSTEAQAVPRRNGGGVGSFAEGVGKTDHTLAVAPEALFSWRNVMIKGGVQIPFLDVDSDRMEDRWRIAADLIVQF